MPPEEPEEIKEPADLDELIDEADEDPGDEDEDADMATLRRVLGV